MAAGNTRLERFVYDDDIVRKFMLATMVWGLVGRVWCGWACPRPSTWSSSTGPSSGSSSAARAR